MDGLSIFVLKVEHLGRDGSGQCARSILLGLTNGCDWPRQSPSACLQQIAEALSSAVVGKAIRTSDGHRSFC